MPSSHLRVTFRDLLPDETLVSLAHRCNAGIRMQDELELLLCAHRDGYRAQLGVPHSGLVVSDSGANPFVLVRNIFAQWQALRAEVDRYTRIGCKGRLSPRQA